MSLQECYYLWFWVPLSYAQSSFDQSLESLHKFRNQKMRICASSSENFMVPAACSSLYVYVEIRLNKRRNGDTDLQCTQRTSDSD